MPIRWSVIYDWDGDTLNLNSVGNIHNLINAIPDDIEIVAYLDSPKNASSSTEPTIREWNSNRGTWYRAFNTDPVTISQRYANYVSFVANEFGGRISSFEIWNEPNNSIFYERLPWAPMDTWGYMNYILINGYTAVKAIDPNARVILGGLAGNGVEGHATPIPNPYFMSNQWHLIPDYLENLYSDMQWVQQSTPPFEPYFDVVATHPYHQSASNVSLNPSDDPMTQTYGSADSTLTALTNVNADSLPIWWTEFGEVYGDDNVVDEGQLLYDLLTDGYNNQRHRSAFPLERIHVFSLRDRIDPQHDTNHGILDENMVPRTPFYFYKKAVLESGNISSLIDDFTSLDTAGVDYTDFWIKMEESSTAGFWGTDSIHIDPGNLASKAAGIRSKHLMPYKDTDTHKLSFKFNSFGHAGGTPDDTKPIYAKVDIGTETSLANDGFGGVFNGIHVIIRRPSDTQLVVHVYSRDLASNYTAPGNELPIVTWQHTNSGDFTWMNEMTIEFDNSHCAIEVKDSAGSVKLSATNVPHNFEFSNSDTIGIRLSAANDASSGDCGFVKFDDVILTNKTLPTADDICPLMGLSNCP